LALLATLRHGRALGNGDGDGRTGARCCPPTRTTATATFPTSCTPAAPYATATRCSFRTESATRRSASPGWNSPHSWTGCARPPLRTHRA